MKLSIDIDTKKIVKDLTDELVDEDGLIRELTLKGEAYSKKECPVDTGDLRRSIGSILKGKEGIVKTDLEYAKHVIYGTSRHTIKVKKKKALSDGKTIYGTKVEHPGTSPNNFPARAVNNIKSELPSIIRKYLKVRK